MKKKKKSKYDEAVERNIQSEKNIDISSYFDDDKFFIRDFNEYFKDLLKYEDMIKTVLRRRLGIRKDDRRFDDDLESIIGRLHREWRRRSLVDWNEFYRIKGWEIR